MLLYENVKKKPILSPTSLKKRLCYRCFPVNFAKLLGTIFLTEHLRWLLLMVQILT